MKRIIMLLLCVMLLSACNGKEKIDETGVQIDNEIQTEVIEQEENDVSDLSEEKKIDIDLTELSSTMVYSEVSNIMNQPDNYIDKKIRMKGVFGYFIDDEQKYHFGCVIADATACCAQGIEFVLADELVYPDDYPEIGAEITVVGDFDYYSNGNFLNPVLYNAKFE